MQKKLNLRQQRWLELLKDYDLMIDYHPGKTNDVTDALSHKSLFALRAMNAHLSLNGDGSVIAELRARPLFLQQIQEFQNDDPKLVAKIELIQSDTTVEFFVSDNGMKREIFEFVTTCLVCQQVKAEHQVQSGLLQSIPISEWKC
ncbi:uncharacterized protein LOC128043139 [Gossypium raimondii]|uniref:uncharacterized protein LOC128043139 n=1 Tax=Gossypium raimondii TaxID=29730 RepID=UPI00227AA92D|nr:uncharacterized protein LOC128043139 [Gossypium raimondii]